MRPIIRAQLCTYKNLPIGRKRPPTRQKKCRGSSTPAVSLESQSSSTLAVSLDITGQQTGLFIVGVAKAPAFPGSHVILPGRSPPHSPENNLPWFIRDLSGRHHSPRKMNHPWLVRGLPGHTTPTRRGPPCRQFPVGGRLRPMNPGSLFRRLIRPQAASYK